MRAKYFNDCDCLRCRISFKPYPRIRLFLFIILIFALTIAGNEFLKS